MGLKNKLIVLIALSLCLVMSTIWAEEPVKPRYGNRVQKINTEVGKLEIRFRDVRDTWRTYPKVYTEMEFKNKQDVYTIDVDLTDDIPLIELKTPDSKYKIAIFFVDITKPFTRSIGYARLICIDPIEIIKVYHVAIPEFKEYYYKEQFQFPANFVVDLSNDPFLNRNQSLERFEQRRKYDAIRSLKPIPEAVKRRMSNNSDGDCIIDDYQKNIRYVEIKDINNDTINDLYQTSRFYEGEKLFNFVDINGDSLCDNYMPGIFDCKRSVADYSNMIVDLRKDIFQCKSTANDVGIDYIDQNLDGINDVFQNTKIAVKLFYQGYPFKVDKFTDVNGDTINDAFQTLKVYNTYHMTTFIDMDGDGLSDTYAK